MEKNWLNLMSLSMVVMAVIASVSAYYAGFFSSSSILNQSLAANQWAYYQAKSTKGHLYEIEQKFLAIRKATISDTSTSNYINRLIEGSKGQIERYEIEKNEIMQQARLFELKRDLFWSRYVPMGILLIFMQLGLLFSSIAGLLKKKRIWYLGLISLGLGILYFIYQYLVIWKAL